MYAMLLRRSEGQDSIAQWFWRDYAIFDLDFRHFIDSSISDLVGFAIGVKEVMCRWIVVIVTRAG